jgi:hypothetical protein
MFNVVGSEQGYKDFVNVMLELDDESFPIVLEREDPMEITLPEIKEFIDQFKKDTDLDVMINIGTCDNCDKLLFTIIVDLAEKINYGKLHVVQ